MYLLTILQIFGQGIWTIICVHSQDKISNARPQSHPVTCDGDHHGFSSIQFLDSWKRQPVPNSAVDREMKVHVQSLLGKSALSSLTPEPLPLTLKMENAHSGLPRNLDPSIRSTMKPRVVSRRNTAQPTHTPSPQGPTCDSLQSPH